MIGKRSGGPPAAETGGGAVGPAAEGRGQGSEDEGAHDEDFGEAEPEFRLAEVVDWEELVKVAWHVRGTFQGVFRERDVGWGGSLR